MDAPTSYRSLSIAESKVRLVIALYEQVARDIYSALGALQQGDIAGRTRAIDHALTVLEQLQGRLDHVSGGEIARNLDQFYGVVRSGLLTAQHRGSATLLREHLQLLLSVRDAWLEVERSQATSLGTPSAGARPLDTSPESPCQSSWKA